MRHFAAAALLLAAPPAHSDGPRVSVYAHKGTLVTGDVVGTTCSLLAGNDVSEVVNNDPTIRYALAAVGPLGPSDTEALDVRVSCWAQAWSADPAQRGWGDTLLARGTPGIAAGARILAFQVTGGRAAPVFVCTKVEWVSRGAPAAPWYHDVDPGPAIGCPRAAGTSPSVQGIPFGH